MAEHHTSTSSYPKPDRVGQRFGRLVVQRFVERRYGSQAYNKRNNHLVTYKGETKPVGQWEKERELPKNAILSRLRYGWTIERAFETPLRKLKTKN
jgi:hypothetical protein